MIYIHFIINPVSGGGKHHLSEFFIKQFFEPEKYKIKADYTLNKKHAIELAKKAASKHPDIIVACGGDGTINEVASCLLGTNIKLGIIPVGSGNGLASHLNIPRDLKKSLEIIKNGNKILIDAGKINQNYFFSNTGIGIDAMIIKKYEHSSGRKLYSYIKAAILSSFEYRTQPAVISFDDKIINLKTFMIFISNSNEMGYGMSLTPNAMLTDGLLDLILIPELSFTEKIALGFHVLQGTVGRFAKAQHHQVQNLRIEMPLKIYTDAQIDGEHYNLKTNFCKISVIPGALNVLV
ncbi:MULTISPECIES: diacylglycerol/lipid kinase family protein [Flavobacterium]|uniref:YegS/Rv2252/BmrU family lipid kinase n=4 Tax=Flavobacteriaceae TaxID=49546 RepID=A0A7W7IXR7_9FLAO|nr:MULTISPECIES: diacylglycerol kinase family protein [Flavobacterium]RED26956.1 YegS/Rv2252/BmrU family lipid kinase [Flavobacterium cutihirudinis]MBB4802569.1 YegS/Rv2252/BmrU family lipid kinase [Flavobacterium nitrogenifigens]MBB6387527.1 YegS/Rv2252/BmrU family lipid kinase [Flavobacterium notoginsengisoli]MBZ4040895.1 diacylglycerol kinase family lipid kinase [Flavobacterium hibisci]MCR4029544.1 diacylglycerol kinase family lipid kinase [Flavobacterium panacis]